MAQVTNGLILGAPGIAGSAPISILYGTVDPSASTDANVSACSQGSLYTNTTTPSLWFKTSASAWTQISIP